MSRFWNYVSTFIFCMIIWMCLVIPFGGGMPREEIMKEALVGGIVSLIVSLFCYRFFIKSRAFWLFNPIRIVAFCLFAVVFFWELFKSNLDVALRALSPKVRVNPGIVKISTKVESDYGLSMLANCITLTPGTITLHIKRKKRKSVMFIHWIDVTTKQGDEAGRIIKGSFEPWVRRVFK